MLAQTHKRVCISDQQRWYIIVQELAYSMLGEGKVNNHIFGDPIYDSYSEASNEEPK